jgi:hypothetical protein
MPGTNSRYDDTIMEWSTVGRYAPRVVTVMNMNPAELQTIRDSHESWLRAQPGVVGTGIGIDKGGRIALKIFTNQMSSATREAITARLADAPVAFEETGEIRKQSG